MGRKSGNFPKKEPKQKPHVIQNNFRASRIKKKVPKNKVEELALSHLYYIQLRNQIAHELGRPVEKVRPREMITYYEKKVAAEKDAVKD